MKKALAVIILGLGLTLLSSCGTYQSFQNSNPGYKYYLKACPASDPNGVWATCSVSASNETLNRAKNEILLDCNNYHGKNNCIVTTVNNQSTFATGTYSGSTGTSSSYSNSLPQLYYDRQTGGMRECLHDPGATGNCLSFKPTLNGYYTNTLFYNPATGAMQPCLQATALGQCQSYTVFNLSTVSKGQLFYDPKNKKMTTCLHVTVSGNCAHYELVPNSYAKNYGGFRMTQDSSNPYYKRVPRTNKQLMDTGMRMLGGGCTLGINC